MKTDEKITIISNPNTPSSTLLDLSKDSDTTVRMHADAACMRRQQELTKKARVADANETRRELASDPLVLYEYLQQWHADFDCAADVRKECKENLEARDWQSDEPVDLRGFEFWRAGHLFDFEAEKPSQSELDSIVAIAKSLGFYKLETKLGEKDIWDFKAQLKPGKFLNSAQNSQLYDVIKSSMPTKTSFRLEILSVKP